MEISVLDNNEKALHLTALLTEYSELRQELRSAINTQFILASMLASATGILFSSGLEAFYEANKQYITKWTICLLCPCVFLFLGVIWLDQVYRQKRYDIYLIVLETNVNKLIKARNIRIESGLYWQRWLIDEIESKKFFAQTNQYFSYIMLGALLVIPICLEWFGLFLFDYNISLVWEWVGATLFFYLVFLAFLRVYVRKILDFQKGIVLHKQQNL